jgi:hypothetical protein
LIRQLSCAFATEISPLAVRRTPRTLALKAAKTLGL